MKRSLLILIPLLAAMGSAQAAQPFPKMPDGAIDDKHPQVVAVYKAQCNDWADHNGLQGSARDAYIGNCLNEIPELIPVGYDDKE
jgi:hypothetical protein